MALDNAVQRNGRNLSASRSLVGVIFAKELREIFTDRRTLFAAVVSPLLITPLIILLSGVFIRSQTSNEEHTLYRVGLVNPGGSAQLARYLALTPNVDYSIVSLADAQREVAAHRLKAAVIVSNSLDSVLASGGSGHVGVLRDPGNDVSNSAAQRLETQLSAFGDLIKTQRLKRAHLPPDFASPIAVDDLSTKGAGTTTMFLLAMFIPYILAISAFSGGMAAASDQIAGEKERGTLETLLVSPASRREIVTGKFFAIACICVTSGLLSGIGLIIPFSLHIGGLFLGATSLGGIKITVMGALIIALAQVPLALLFAGMLAAISSFARSQKEVQVYQAPLLMLILLPAMGTMFVTTDQPVTTAFIPVLNSTLLIKQILAGVHDTPFLIAAIASSCIYAAIGIACATAIFEDERILLKS